MNFAQPLLLLALLPLGWAICVLGRGRLRRLPPLRAAAILAIRLAITALLVGALAGPTVRRDAAGVHVVFLIDRSTSMGRQTSAAAVSWVESALRARHASDSASVVAFGALPLWPGTVQGPHLPPLPGLDETGTDIAAAVRLALAGLPQDQSSHLVLLSDGHQTNGDALQAAQEAAAVGVPISVVNEQPAPIDDVAVTGLDLPAYSRSGDHLTLRVSLYASRAMTAQLRLSVDGVVAGAQIVHLASGATTLYFAQTAGAPGTHVYRAQVGGVPDGIPQNDSLDAATVVSAPPRVLVVANDASARTLVATLRRGGMQVQTMSARQVPATSAGLSGYDAVVLADVAASALPVGSAGALESYVREQGHGLLVTGGPHSFAAGGYAGSALEPLLPLSSEVAAHTGRSQVGLVLLIDKSGSMMDGVRGVSKISMAQQAAIDAASHLQSGDRFGVLAFDDTTHTVVPFSPVGDAANKARAREQILRLQPFGDTVIYPALQQAARWLFASHLPFKHIVLLTDGQGEDAPYLNLIKRMRSYGITLSTIGIGADAEVDELKTWANAGNGRFYYTADPRDIPRLVVQETRISSGPTRVQGIMVPHQATASTALRSLSGQQLPPVSAYNIAAARDGAQVVLQSGLGDPLLAQWQYGLGRVAAWTAGSSGDWARSWLGQTAFWSDLLRGLMATPEPRTLRPELSAGDGLLHIAATAFNQQGGFANLLATRAVVTAPDGGVTSVPLVQNAPGHYVTTVVASRPGVYRVRLAQLDGSAVLAQADGAVSVPYSAEFAPPTGDTALLTEMATISAGPPLHSPGDAFNAAGLPARRVPHDIWPMFALLALLLFPLDVALRMLYRPPEGRFGG